MSKADRPIITSIVCKNIGIITEEPIPLKDEKQGEQLLLTAINIFYGRNGSGKSSLVRAISLFSAELLDREGLFKILTKVEANEASVTLKLSDSSDRVLTRGRKNAANLAVMKGLMIFNKDFVENNIYNAAKEARQFFKENNAGTENQNGQPVFRELADIKNSIERTQGIIDSIGKYQEAHKPKLKEILGEVRAYSFALISDKNMPSMDMKEFASLNHETIDITALEAEVRRTTARLQAAQEAAKNTEEHKQSLDSIAFSCLYVPDIFQVLRDSVSTSAENALKARMDRYKAFPDNNNWFQGGQTRILNTNDPSCPLCGNEIDRYALLHEFKSCFDETWSEANKALESAEKQCQANNSSIISNHKAYQELAKLCKKIQGDNATIPELYAIPAAALDKIIAWIKDKRRDVSQGIEISDAEIEEIVSSYNEYNKSIEAIKAMHEKLRQYLESIEQTRKDLDQDLRSSVRKLSYIKLAKDEVLIERGQELINEAKEGPNEILAQSGEVASKGIYSKVEALKDIMVRQKQDLDRAYKSKLDGLKLTSRAVNKTLHDLGIRNFTIDLDSDEGIFVKYQTGGEKQAQENLSAGEMTALALAYFVSKFEAEKAKGPYIVCIDDPISDLDDNILFTTALLLAQTFGPSAATSQLFVFSHNLRFLQSFLHAVSHEAKARDIANFIIAEGKVTVLPDRLKWYMTDYFHNLSQMADYKAGKLQYEDARQTLPTIIRRTVESFCHHELFLLVLKKDEQDKDKKRKKPPTISDYANLIEAQLNKKCGAESESTTDLVKKLRGVAHFLNSLVHGSAGDYDGRVDPSPDELKRHNEDALDCMDQIRALNLADAYKSKSEEERCSQLVDG